MWVRNSISVPPSFHGVKTNNGFPVESGHSKSAKPQKADLAENPIWNNALIFIYHFLKIRLMNESRNDMIKEKCRRVNLCEIKNRRLK